MYEALGSPGRCVVSLAVAVDPSVADAALSCARAGDHEAFASVVGPHWRELLAHAYRMLGSTTDAEDALQEALLSHGRGPGPLRRRDHPGCR